MKELTGEAEYLADHTIQDWGEKAPEPPKAYSAAIYLVELRSGGPEEGGWWYDSGEPSDDADHMVLTRIFKDREEAWEYANRVLTPVCEKENEHRMPKSSVISNGVYEVHVTEGYPTEFPEKRPHYE